jgi:hypothetical protein
MLTPSAVSVKLAVPVVLEPFIGASVTVAAALLVEVVVSWVTADVPSEEEEEEEDDDDDDDDVVSSSSSEAPLPPPVPPQLNTRRRKRVTAIVGKTSFTTILSPYPSNAGKRHHIPWT